MNCKLYVVMLQLALGKPSNVRTSVWITEGSVIGGQVETPQLSSTTTKEVRLMWSGGRLLRYWNRDNNLNLAKEDSVA